MLFSASIKQKMMPTLKMSLKNYQMKKRADLKKQRLKLRVERALRLSPMARMPRQNASRKPSPEAGQDRKSTRLNSSHMSISYAVFRLKKEKRPRSPGLQSPPSTDARRYRNLTKYP